MTYIYYSFYLLTKDYCDKNILFLFDNLDNCEYVVWSYIICMNPKPDIPLNII